MERFRHMSLVTLQAFTALIGMCCIGLMSFAHNYDEQWNDLVEKENSNGSLTEQKLEDLIRISYSERAYIGISTILCIGSIACTVIYGFFYLRTRKWMMTNIYLNAGAAAILLIFASLLTNSAIQFNAKYQEIYEADPHDVNSDYYFCNIKNYGEYLQLNDEQKEILDSEKVCQRWGFKYAAASLSLINSGIHLLIVWMEFWLRESNKKAAVVFGPPPRHRNRRTRRSTASSPITAPTDVLLEHPTESRKKLSKAEETPPGAGVVDVEQ